MNKRQTYWILYILRFNFTLKHISETKIEKINKLSKRLDWKVKVEKNNENQTLINEQWICNLVKVI